jgi:hypothetical protein
VLTRAIIAGSRRPTASDIDQIIERAATAPFNPEIVVVPRSQRGLAYFDDTLGRRAPSVLAHLVKRILAERQWSNGTTVADYLDDLRRGVRHEAARHAVFARRGGSMFVSLAPTDAVVPEERRGPRWDPIFVVVYSADRGIIVSGDQASTLGMVAIPGDVQWLT